MSRPLAFLAACFLTTVLAVPAGATRNSIGRVRPGHLSLKDGNFFCNPHDCAIALKPGQQLAPWQDSEKIFVLQEGGKTLRYYFYSTDIVKIPAYSGKPIGILIGLSPAGIIDYTKLISMDEPILLAGIPASKLVDAVVSYQGKDIRDKIRIGKPASGYISIDMITGATVTSLVTNETVLSSSRKVAVRVGILERQASVAKAQLSKAFEPKTWDQLVEMGAIAQLTIYPQQMGLPNSKTPWLDMYFADLVQPTIGQNILGKSVYDWLMGTLEPTESALMVVGNGTWQGGFKGSAFVRGGIYDRFRIEQGMNTFTFRDVDYDPLYSIAAKGAPQFAQSGVFIVTSPLYDRTQPWTMQVLGSRLTGKTAVSKLYHTFSATYQFPPSLFTAPKVVAGTATPGEPGEFSILEQVWVDHEIAIVWYITLWLFVITLFIFRRRMARNERRLEWIRIGVFVASILTIGVFHRGQPSVVNIFTLVDVIRERESYRIFFMDPFLAVGWIMIALTTAVWGRSLFCGWICPFGALQELLYKIRTKLTPLHKPYGPKVETLRRLRIIRFFIFISLFIVSLFSMKMAELLAEVEPFKTTWNIGIFDRPAEYGIYLVALLMIGIFIYRFFCRYLCPLGAALALVSFFPPKPIPRRNSCVVCKKCRRECEPQAINDKGQINAAECMGCFNCIHLMDDKTQCPPLISAKWWKKFNEKPV